MAYDLNLMGSYSTDVDVSGSDVFSDITMHTPDVAKGDVTVHTPDVAKGDVTTRVDGPVQGEVSFTTPIVTTSSVDIQPLVSDTCVRVSLARTRVCQPYSTRVSFSVLGYELFAVETAGELRTLV